jgi:hypothetical protein
MKRILIHVSSSLDVLFSFFFTQCYYGCCQRDSIITNPRNTTLSAYEQMSGVLGVNNTPICKVIANRSEYENIIWWPDYQREGFNLTSEEARASKTIQSLLQSNWFTCSNKNGTQSVKNAQHVRTILCDPPSLGRTPPPGLLFLTRITCAQLVDTKSSAGSRYTVCFLSAYVSVRQRTSAYVSLS